MQYPKLSLLKSLAKRSMRVFGFEVRRLSKDSALPSSTDRSRKLRFGSHTIITDNLELVRSYQEFPETNAAIGRLVSLLSRRMPAAMIDIGANCGDTLAIAKQAAPDIEVLCVEGDEHLLSTLTRNAAQYCGVTIRHCYLGEEKKEISVMVAKRGQNNTLVHDDKHRAEKEVIAIETLDGMVGSWRGLSNLRLIKCDTEGYDVRILFGAHSTIREHQPVLYFEYNRLAMQSNGETGLRVFSMLSDAGYKCAGLYDPLGRFMLKLDLSDHDLIDDIHNYADGRHGNIYYYYDIVAFARRDGALADEYFEQERHYRHDSD